MSPRSTRGDRFEQVVERSEATSLLEAMLEEIEPISVAMVERIRREIPSFRHVPLDQHRADTRSAAESLIRSRLPADGGSVAGSAGEGSVDEGGVSGHAAADLSELGRRRAEQGVPVEDALRAWRISVELGTTEASRLARERGLDPALVFTFFQEVLEAADQAMVTLADAYSSTAKQAETRTALLQRFAGQALAGELEGRELRERATELGIDTRASYRVFRIPAAAAAAGTAAALRSELERTDDGSEGPRGAFVEIDEGFTGFLSGELSRGTAELVAFGPPVDLTQLPVSSRIASRVASGARSFGLRGIQTLASAGVYVAVTESPDIGEALAARYVDPVREASSGEEILASVREWFASAMRVGPAAKRLHVHPNTLRYRLNRYAELTGSDIGETEQAVAAWLALQNDLISR